MDNFTIKDLEKMFDPADKEAGQLMKRDFSGKQQSMSPMLVLVLCQTKK